MDNFEKKCATIIREICQRCERSLSENYIKSWLKSCIKLGEKKALFALGEIYKKAKQGYMIPSIFEFEQLAESETEPSLQIAERIVRGMQLYGAYNHDKAKDYVGELGWKIVQNNGGWQEMCYTTNMNHIYYVKKDLQKQIKIFKKEEKNLKLIT
ncbi:hypothetical protein GCL60_16805 [Silvanigrella paludirubra]|uniref:Uncharacterized protein n=1 Tax=Silvanigrella paludirubra TaxID=2499159 RepID=A0A6N6VQF3_9BACT|nr:hypothetical protein [Silvanigrella paludirubra]KAB8035890.1 hypothetical protein GCL60_16805 [Silvanigrella paludirubra]